MMGRSVFANGARGNASLLYPVEGSDNRLMPGTVVQIPGTSFFSLTRDRDDEVSETLTLLILPEPIADPLNAEKLVAWEGRWKVPVHSIEEVDQIGKPITRAEMQTALPALEAVSPKKGNVSPIPTQTADRAQMPAERLQSPRAQMQIDPGKPVRVTANRQISAI